MSSDHAARDTGRGLAGLIDVLDRAEGVLPRRSARPARSAAYRTTAHRAGGSRAVALRPVPPAPAARPAPVAAPPLAAVPSAVPAAPRAVVVRPRPPAPRPGLVRRLALWGAGPDGAYLAWGAPAAASMPARETGPRGLRGLVRRLALWGAGPDGAYLAWRPFPSAAVPTPVARPHEIDPPVVLRELPSTPTIEPAASSPAAALPLPRSGASNPGAGAPGGRVPSSGVRTTGAPSTGLVRARGDPLTCPARGSPLRPAPGRSPPATGQLRDHGTQPRDAVLAAPPSTPRTVTDFPG